MNTVYESVVLVGSFLLLLLIFFIILSIRENEIRAAKRGFYVLIMGSSLVAFTTMISNEVLLFIVIFISFIFLGSIFLYFSPIGYIRAQVVRPTHQVDERDIPFSRIRLIPGTEEFISYYKKSPDNLAIDDKIRKLPGLLSANAKFANHIAFSTADASFDFIETFRSKVEQPKSQPLTTYSEADLSLRVKQVARYYGAFSVGITTLEKYHMYSHIGRGTGIYGAPIKLEHRYAIPFTVEMDYRMTRSGPKPPIVMESAKEYVEAAKIAMQLAIFISKLGYSARAHIDSNYRVIAPLVARDAGLGEIGRMGLLMTPQLGPRVRLGVVTTDMPMAIDEYKPDVSIIDFCTFCKKCAENCPSHSIPFDDRHENQGALRWQIDADRCFFYWNIIGTDCGRCIAVCPYSHANNIMHNAVRKLIRYSGFARRGALTLDDLIYGRFPQEFPLPKWLSGSEKS